MRVDLSRLRPLSIGVALDEHRLLAVLPGKGDPQNRLWTRELEPAASNGAPWSNLDEALCDLKSRIRPRRAQLHVALLPPLAQLRLVEMPGVNEAEAAVVVSRDPSRFFANRDDSLVIELDGTGWRRRSPFMVTTASHAAIEAVDTAVRGAGFKLRGIVPAPLAWAASLPRSSSPRDLLVAIDTQLLLLRVRNQRIIFVRRLPNGELDASPALLRERMALDGIVPAGDATCLFSLDDAMACAASSVTRVSGPILLPDPLRACVRQREQWAVRARLAAAVLLLIGAGALALAGLQRERSEVAVERSRLKAAAARSLLVRDSIALLRERLALLRDMETTSHEWSSLMSSIADALPREAFLNSLSATGDSLRLEGSSERAAPVFDALASVAGIGTVHPTAPIRQELRGSTLDEHFALSALITPPRRASGRVVLNGSELSAIGRQP